MLTTGSEWRQNAKSPCCCCGAMVNGHADIFGFANQDCHIVRGAVPSVFQVLSLFLSYGSFSKLTFLVKLSHVMSNTDPPLLNQ